MPTKYLKILEYDKVLEQLASHCKTYLGKEKCSQLKPDFTKENVMDSLAVTKEAISLIQQKGSIPLSETPNISTAIKTLESNGILSFTDLLNIAKFLKISREVREYFFSLEEARLIEYPKIHDLFDLLYSNKHIEDNIFSILIDENTIADDASPKLASLRKQSKKVEQDIRDKLNNIIHSSTYSKYIMEPIVTIRAERYVIPIKEEYRTQIKGFIHAISSSGSTVFLEPLSVFELNNSLSNLKLEEEIEIEQILANLSAMLYDYTPYLQRNISLLEDLDLLFAKASYSLSINGIEPCIQEEKWVNLIDARHPLIDKKVVVPISISVGKDYRSLVITGPNTGGKTVSLKTFGLLLLMAYTGIYIPAREGSTLCVFDHIFVDIGDEQSIQENLSTFSSHITNIVEITKVASANSLVLLDELGSGTDPVEGASLAISILKYFYYLGSIVISTTHYQELKHYCLTTPGFENASFEFDIENLKPTYHLLIGIPGKSNAFEISKKLGLPEEILHTANTFLKKDAISMEELMKTIYDNKIAIEKEKTEVEKNANQVETLRKNLEKESLLQKERKDKIIEAAKEEARQIISSAKKEVNSIIKDLNSLEKGNLSKANTLRNNLNAHLKEVAPTSESGLNLEMLKALNDKFSLKNNAKKYEAEKSKGKSLSHSSVTFSKENTFKAQTIASEINVIGMNVEEATSAIDKYLDDCAIAKLSPIRIVHGKGTGKLREGIHQFLKRNPHVKTYRLGTFGEGEMGVTIVELK